MRKFTFIDLLDLRNKLKKVQLHPQKVNLYKIIHKLNNLKKEMTNTLLRKKKYIKTLFLNHKNEHRER